MTYEEVIYYLENTCPRGAKLGLERTEILLDRLGNPQDSLKIVHVAGTNGKGSCCAFLSQVLKEAGYNVGVYTSPHLEGYNERFTINGQNISDNDFIEIFKKVKIQCDIMENESIGKPTIFEILTAMGFLYFYYKNVDVVVLEVGLGGRLDSTNVIKKPVVSVIMSISMDHMDYLGNTWENIAFEKGGIIKYGCPVVLYKQDNCVMNVIKDIANKNSSPLYISYGDIDVISQNVYGETFNIKCEYFDYNNLEIKLIGNFQIKNCAAVLTAIHVLKKSGFDIPDLAIYSGLKNAIWHGRMEFFKGSPDIIIDGAHNVGGISEFVDSLKTYFPNRNITLLFGILGDKEYEKAAEMTANIADNIVITEPDSFRALDAEKLEKIFEAKSQKSKFFIEKDIEKAFNMAIEVTKKDGLICCVGSLYLIGRIRPLILNMSRRSDRYD